MSKIKGFIDFSSASMGWCKDESEKSIGSIMDVVSHLSEDVNRVSALSTEALGALSKIKEKIFLESENDKVHNLTSALVEFQETNKNVGETINPIVQSLQFQDRVTQNLDNIKRMIELWWEVRDENLSSKEFGEKILKKTTMEEERNIIRGVISGLPEEEEKKGALLF